METAGPVSSAPDIATRLLSNVETVVRGKTEEIRLVLTALVCGGHVLLEDVPGTAKTVLARAIAGSVEGAAFQRIQCTPDLQPTDVTGLSVFNQRDRDFEFRPGPVFANVLLVDEINRASPKTQSALLEAMQETQVTVDGATHALERPFLVIATQNPIEYEGTYPLPEAQLDRFMVRLGVGYPEREDEWRMLEGRIERARDDIELERIVDRQTLVAMQRAIEQVHVSESIGYYIVDLVAATRSSGQVEVGASPRGSLALLKLSRCRAALFGRDFVTPEDVKGIAVPALAHRLMLRPELWVRRVRPEDVVASALDTVPTPAPEDVART